MPVVYYVPCISACKEAAKVFIFLIVMARECNQSKRKA